MNTSANTNQTRTTTTCIARATPVGFRRRTMAGTFLVMAFTAIAVGLAATSHADDGAPAPSTDAAATALPATNCKTDLWGFLGSQRRTLCDGPISKDGSWSRERTIWVPAHHTPYICSSSLSSHSYSSCYGGYFVDQHEVSRETYPVRPDTVLPDEPGHLD